MIIGGPLPGSRLPSVWSDDGRAVTEAVAYLAALGHRRIVHVSGPGTCCTARCAAGAYGPPAPPRASSRWSSPPTTPARAAPRRPGGCSARPGRRRRSSTTTTSWPWPGSGWRWRWASRCPAELSIVAGDDSALCQVVRPDLTVLKRDIVGYGAHAAQLLLRRHRRRVAGRGPRPRRRAGGALQHRPGRAGGRRP